MATKSLMGMFQNNRRREAHSVTCTIPAVIATADPRENIPNDELIAVGDVLELLEIPANVIVTEACIVVTDPMDSTTCTLKLDIDTIVLAAAAPVAADNTSALVDASTNLPALITAPTKVTATVVALTGILTRGSAKLVLSYIDFDRATMSYIGEQ